MTVSPSHEYEMVEMDECMTENEIENRRRVFKLLEKVRLLEEFNKAVVDAGFEIPRFHPTLKVIRKEVRK